MSKVIPHMRQWVRALFRLRPAATSHRPFTVQPLAPPPLHCRTPLEAPLNGDATRLIRPYLVAHEQRVRRHELALATLGVDGPGPYVIHGVEVP